MADSRAPLPVSGLYSTPLMGSGGRVSPSPGYPAGETGRQQQQKPPFSSHPPALPADQPLGAVAVAVPADQPPAVPADHSPAVPAVQTPAMPAVQSAAVPADHPPAVPADQPPAVPADQSAAVPADQPPAVPADQPPAVPADHSPAVPAVQTPAISAVQSASVPADQPPAEPAVQPPAEPAVQAPAISAVQSAAVPADHSPAMPTVQTPAISAVQSPAVPAVQTPAISAVQSASVPAVQSPAVPAVQTPAISALQSPAMPSARPAAVPSSPRCPSGSRAPDTVSAADSVSLYGAADSVSMYGTAESLLPEDGSSMGSDSEINGSTASARRTDKYGFLGGTQFSSSQESAVPVDVARQRELKWLDMLGRWDKWVARRFDKVKLRCRKGIPSSLRARAWQQLSNSKLLMDQNPGKFEELDRQQGDPKWLDIIEKDLHRQFPFHEMFALRGGHGQQDLYRILKAYTIYRPEEGYCQAQAPVAAVLLMHMPAEQAFWCLVQICEKYLPGYYSAGLEAIQLDGEIFFSLLRRVSPLAHRHLKKFKIDPILYMTEWFMCVFSRTLPWSSVLRVWDMFFCDGVKVIFKVGLVLLRHTLGSPDKLRDCQGMYETMERLRSIPAQYLQEDFLVQEVISLKVTEGLIERENQAQRRRWTESRGELQHKPSRRLYGARAIREESVRLNPPLSGSPSLLSLSASIASLRWGKDEKKAKQPFGPRPPPSPSHSIRSLAYSAGPRPQPTASSSPTLSLRGERPRPLAQPQPQPQPGPVVSEGLRPSLPSPTSSVSAFGVAPPTTKEERRKEKERARQRAKEQARREKEQARREKEQARRDRKEQERERRQLKAQPRKKEHKGGKRENGASDGGAGASSAKDGPGSGAAEPSGSASVLKDGYF